MGVAGHERRVVWVVDDSPLDTENARRALAPAYRVETFADGSALLERLAHAGGGESAKTARPIDPHQLPDVIVLDWVMPGISGPDVCRFLRSPSGMKSDVAILLLTAQGEKSQVVEGLQAGANDFLTKPYAKEELLARIVALLRTKALIERAEQAESIVKRLLSSAPDAILAVNVEGRVTYANTEAERVFYDRLPLLGRTISELLPDLAVRNISVGVGESLVPLPDVKVGDDLFAPTLRVLPTDNAATTTIALRNVTDRRRADARRLDFYSIIAHDLRSPLSAMLLRIEMIVSGRRGMISSQVIEDVRRLQANMRSMSALINDFLELARLEGVGYKIEREETDLQSLIRATMEDVKPLLDESQLDWRAEGNQESVRLKGDPRRLMQVLTNLIGNAIKFTPPGGHITTRVEVAEEFAEVSICDTGRGIAPEVIPSLFQRYARALDTQHQVAGTGLGLLIVREIIEAHGGTVGATSVPGQGSTFWFRLPLAPPPDAA